MNTNIEIISDLNNLASETNYKVKIEIPIAMPNRVVFQFKTASQVSEFAKVLYTFYKHRFMFYPLGSTAGFSIDIAELRDHFQIKETERMDAVKATKKSPKEKKEIKKEPPKVLKTKHEPLSWVEQSEVNALLENKKKERRELLERLKKEGKLGTKPHQKEETTFGMRKGHKKRNRQLPKRLKDFEEYRNS